MQLYVDLISPISVHCRTLSDGQVQLKYNICCPEHSSNEAAGHIGALVATCHKDGASPKLQNSLVQLAQALSAEHRSLLEFSTSVGSALFGPPHSPAESSDFHYDSEDLESEDEEEADSDQAPEQQRELHTSPVRSGGILSFVEPLSNAGRLWPLPPLPTASSAMTAGLSFVDSRHETAFQLWHGRHMLKFDFAAFALCVALQTLIVFSPLTSLTINTLAPWVWLVGYTEAILFLVLSTQQGRKYYICHRNEILIALQAIMLWYHHCLVANYMGHGSVLLCSVVAYNFLWIPYTTLVFQAQFKLLAPMMVLCAAVNLTLLKEMCASCDGIGGMPWWRCAGRAAAKVSTMLGMALCTVYCIEWRARRVWAAMQAVRDD